MAKGIVVCGLNGCGKSTLSRALAEKLGLYFIDNENLYFSRNAADEPYANPRTRAEAEALLMEEVRRHGDFVFAAVKGDYGSAILPLYRYAVLIEVPKEIRLRRVRDRSFQKFGGRMKPGGDFSKQRQHARRTMPKVGRGRCPARLSWWTERARWRKTWNGLPGCFACRAAERKIVVNFPEMCKT